MHIRTTLHIHPAVTDLNRVFEVRRLARDVGCTFSPRKLKPQARINTRPPIDPYDGGRAA